MVTLLRKPGVARPHPDAMTLSEHLGELRRRLVICVLVFVATAVVAWLLYPHVLKIMEQPYCRSLGPHHDCDLVALGPLDAFGIRLDITGYGGLVLAAPVILWELWRFVTPGLKANEKRYAIPFVLAAFGLFLFGAYIAWLTFPHALGFLHAVGGPGIEDLFTPQKYLTLILALMAIFGLAFEFPVVLVALELARVITPIQLKRWRRIAIIVIVVFAGVITPSSDPFSMLALAVPMVVFYEASIIIGRLLKR
jgi:sec-independent protein translocase protein TatC